MTGTERFLGVFFVATQIAIGPLLLPYIVAEYGPSPLEISLFVSAFPACAFLMGLALSTTLRNLQPRHILIAGLTVSVAANLIASVSDSLVLFILMRAVAGACNPCVGVVTYTSASDADTVSAILKRTGLSHMASPTTGLTIIPAMLLIAATFGGPVFFLGTGATGALLLFLVLRRRAAAEPRRPVAPPRAVAVKPSRTTLYNYASNGLIMLAASAFLGYFPLYVFDALALKKPDMVLSFLVFAAAGLSVLASASLSWIPPQIRIDQVLLATVVALFGFYIVAAFGYGALIPSALVFLAINALMTANQAILRSAAVNAVPEPERFAFHARWNAVYQAGSTIGLYLGGRILVFGEVFLSNIILAAVTTLGVAILLITTRRKETAC